MDIFETRRTRLKMLIERTAKGNVAAFASKYGYSRSQISQYLSETYNEGRSIGERAARLLEAKTAIQDGWLDHSINTVQSFIFDATSGALTDTKTLTIESASDPNSSNLITRNIPLAGIVAPLEFGVVEIHDVPKAKDQKFVEYYSSVSDAYALLVRGSGLRPRAKSGEYLAIEPSTKPVPGDDVFVRFADGSQMILQFLYVREDELTFGDVNEQEPTATVPEYDIVSIGVVAAILKSTPLADSM